MNLVDEQDVVLLEVREDGGKIALPLDDGAGGHLDADAHLPGQDVGQRRLAEAGRAGEQDVVEGFPALSGRLDEDGEAFLHALLADIFGQRPRPERPFLLAFFFEMSQDPPGCFFRPFSPWLPMS